MYELKMPLNLFKLELPHLYKWDSSEGYVATSHRILWEIIK